MEKLKLTMDILNNARQYEVLFTGYIVDNKFGFNINGTNKLLKFTVCRGQINDWCIYAEDCFRDMTFDEVVRCGHKVFPNTAKVVIDADKEVWDRYRL